MSRVAFRHIAALTAMLCLASSNGFAQMALPSAQPATAPPPKATPKPAAPKPKTVPKASTKPKADPQAKEAPKAAKTDALPPESDDPNVDLAYGAFQEGRYKTALALATRRATEKGDPKSMTLIGEIYSNGFGVKREPAWQVVPP